MDPPGSRERACRTYGAGHLAGRPGREHVERVATTESEPWTENVDKRTWATDVAPRATRVTDHPLNIVKPRWNYEPRSKFYSIRVVEQWNSLPNSVREAKTFNSFKNLYDAVSYTHLTLPTNREV